MPQKNINNAQPLATSSAVEFVAFSSAKKTPLNTSPINENVLAIQTCRIPPFKTHSDSDSPYQGFNLGLHVGDLFQQVDNNRQLLQKLLPKNTKIQWLEQVHGNTVAEVTNVSSQPLVADASFTKEKDICLAIMTADCLPILLASKAGDEIAGIHGGWRPLANNIITHTINKMSTQADQICAWLGPCIGKEAFEVGQEVFDTFVSKNKSFSQAFVKRTSGKYLADLQRIAYIQLSELGVEHIDTLPECTFSNTDKYYSYRKETKTGRMASLICLR
jgi:YfiH family protein